MVVDPIPCLPVASSRSLSRIRFPCNRSSLVCAHREAIMLPIAAIVPLHSSLAPAAIPHSRSPSYGRSPSRGSCRVSRGAVRPSSRHRGLQLRFSLSGGSSDESTSSSTGVVGDNETPFSESREEEATEEDTLSTDGGRLGDLGLLQTRRFWLGSSVGALAALGGNLGGITSSIFNLSPELSRSVRADVVFPVLGFKRCLETSQGFEFIYPMSWVGDQRLLYRAVERAERERSLDLPPIQRRPSSSSTRASSGDPVVAFGPPGTAGELNVSVVVAPVYPGFALPKIGGPREAGELILRQFIAPEGSQKVATLLNARERTTDNQLYYNLEYSVRGPTFFRHNFSVYTTSSGLLYSLNAQASESDWVSVQAEFLEIANSFKLLL